MNWKVWEGVWKEKKKIMKHYKNKPNPTFLGYTWWKKNLYKVSIIMKRVKKKSGEKNGISFEILNKKSNFNQTCFNGNSQSVHISCLSDKHFAY